MGCVRETCAAVSTWFASVITSVTLAVRCDCRHRSQTVQRPKIKWSWNEIRFYEITIETFRPLERFLFLTLFPALSFAFVVHLMCARNCTCSFVALNLRASDDAGLCILLETIKRTIGNLHIAQNGTTKQHVEMNSYRAHSLLNWIGDSTQNNYIIQLNDITNDTFKVTIYRNGARKNIIQDVRFCWCIFVLWRRNSFWFIFCHRIILTEMENHKKEAMVSMLQRK